MAIITGDRCDYFPFMELSAELRLMIYRMALRNDGPLSLSVHRPNVSPPNEAEDAARDSSEDEDSAAAAQGFAPEVNVEDPLRARAAAQARRVALHREVRSEAATAPPVNDAPVSPPRAGPDSSQRRSARSRRGGAGTVPLRQAAGPEERPSPRPDIVPNILSLNRQINREARSVLYSENVIKLDLATSIFSVNSLRQPTRSLLKHIRVTIASYHDILDGFSDLVRLALRYCWGLQTLTICLSGGWPTLPSDHISDGRKGNVYANAFHILRWLPKTTKVILEGDPSSEIRKVVEQCGRTARELDEVAYQKRQHQLPERA